jgi:hypothetical protein|tara:strand:+ start:401 stop:592 length:192 start_codon:yes stop_codon:yes gene_type:complete
MEENKVYQLFEEMKSTIAEVQNDVDKFAGKGNGSAGTRVRKAMQELKNLGQEVRKEISVQKNS